MDKINFVEEVKLKPWLVFDLFVLLILFPFNYFYLYLWGVRFKSPVYCLGTLLVRRARGSTIILGKNVEIRNGTWANVIGINHKTCLATRTKKAEIIIGDNVGISGSSIVAAESVRIGDNVLIGANCMIIDNDFHQLSSEGRRYSKTDIGIEPVLIGNNVFIGANTIILKGTFIGDNAVIGAGSVVRGKIPENSIAFGNPVLVKSIIKK